MRDLVNGGQGFGEDCRVIEAQVEDPPADPHAARGRAYSGGQRQRFQWELGGLDTSPVHQVVVQPDRVIAEGVGALRFADNRVSAELRMKLDTKLHRRPCLTCTLGWRTAYEILPSPRRVVHLVARCHYPSIMNSSTDVFEIMHSTRS